MLQHRLLGRAAGPEQQQLRASAGDGDVGQPLGFRHLFGMAALPDRPAEAPVAVQGDPPTSCRAIPPQGAGDVTRLLGTSPEVGADHQRKFQTLAAVNRHHRHSALRQVAVGFAGLWQWTGGMQPLPPQPQGSSGQIQTLTVHLLLHQAGCLLQISQHPPLVGQTSRTFSVQQPRQATQQPQPRQLIRCLA